MDVSSLIRVFIVDDHQLVVDGIQSLLTGQPGIRITGHTTVPENVIAMLAANPADVVIADVNMPGMNGVELTHLIRETYPEVRVVILSMFGDRHVIGELVRAGISGYLLKNTGKAELISAIGQVYSGQPYFSGPVLKEMMRDAAGDPPGSRLTNREIEIIRLIEQELPNKQIADKLFISERTVETHRKNIFRKTGTATIIGLVKYAYEHKLI